MQASADSNKMPSIFQLIVGSKQTYRRKPQQDLVDSSSLKTIIFETSDAFSRRLIVTFIKPNANFPLSKSSLQSAPNSLFKRNDKFIVVSKSRAPNESVSNKDFQLVVNSKLNLNSEGARAVPITSYSFYEGAQQHSSGNATETNGINFGESVRHQVDEKNEFRVDYVGNNPFQQTNLPLIVDDSSKSQLIVKSKSEGARAAPNHSSQLSVASINSEISFHFCDNCRIFLEGVKGATAIPNGLFGRNLAFGLISAFGQNLTFGRTTAFGLLTAFGYITVGCCITLQLRNGRVNRTDLVDHNGLVGRNDLVDHIGLDFLGHNGLNGVIGLGVSFIGFVGQVGLVNIVILVGLNGIGLIGYNGLVGFIGIGLVAASRGLLYRDLNSDATRKHKIPLPIPN
jgi:hypothetical protein